MTDMKLPWTTSASSSAPIVFFLFPIPFLLDFAVSHGEDWTGTVAYVAIAVLADRRGRRRLGRRAPRR